MIVRILGEGQYELAGADAERLTALDGELDAAVSADDEAKFHTTLTKAVTLVHDAGTPVPAEDLVPAEFIIPFADATLDEVRKLLEED